MHHSEFQNPSKRMLYLGVSAILKGSRFFCQVVPRLFETWSMRWGVMKRLISFSLNIPSVDGAAVSASVKALLVTGMQMCQNMAGWQDNPNMQKSNF